MMMRTLSFLSILVADLVFLACDSVVPPSASVTPRPLEILFLGHDSEHHHSAAYLPMLQSTLSPKGFHFTYEENPTVLSNEYLKHFDAIILYANHEEISTSQASALLSFVKSGGGFMPIHCASYCFRNNRKVVRLMGGQFVAHDTATFEAMVSDETHPVMQDFRSFESWDETYEHRHFEKGRTVLMHRGDEPYTWVKEYGHGRVFYTALGHDERTWSRPEFHQLIENGLLWIVGEAKAEALSDFNLAPLEYSLAKIPNYEDRDPPPMLQAPLTPEQSQTRIQVPSGFRLELFASEPDIINPVSMAWDEKGRLWILETKDYPNNIKLDPAQGQDQIKILEDTDGDGRADKFTVFADRLSVPTSIVFSNGGVIVSQAPHFLFLKDNDGDDIADERKTIISGWGTFDTHAGPSNLQYGFDNKIWGVVGYSSFEGKVGDQDQSFRQGAYRFDPDGQWLEFMGSTSNNTWGLGFTEDFDVLISTANNTHSAFLGIPDTYFEGVKGVKVKSVKKIDGHYAFHPNTANFRQVDVFGGFTAAAGHHIYTARDYPREYWNRIALVCEPTGHLLHRAIIEKDGAGYVERDGWNLLASSDEWVSPVHAQVGPDGAVWILDWYNFIIQHNPTPPGFENGPGNAHINPLRDLQHGRIYRLVHSARSREAAFPDLSSQEGRLRALASDNMFWRLHAQRLLVESGDQSLKDELLGLCEDSSTDEVGLNGQVVHALWTLHGLGHIKGEDPAVRQLLSSLVNHASAGVRKNALRVLPVGDDSFREIVEDKSFNDREQQVRLAAILKLLSYPSSDTLAEQFYKLSTDNDVLSDEWLSRAVYIGVVKHKELYKSILEKNPDIVSRAISKEKREVDWSSEDQDTKGWEMLDVPRRWSKTDEENLQDFDGIVWQQLRFELSNVDNSAATLHLGPIDDSDQTFVNGKLVGSMTRKWNDARQYEIPQGVLQEGTNVLTIKITDSGGRGGMYGEEDDLYLSIGSTQVSLSGAWRYKIEEVFRPNVEVFEEGLSINDLFILEYGESLGLMDTDLLNDNNEYDRVIELTTLPDQMKYDTATLSVKAGERIKFIFRNNDGMQHNLLIGPPGSLELIGKLADEIAISDSGEEDLGYIPDSDYVLASIGLIDPGDSGETIWQVPSETGTYIYVCTFPGHWRTMNGIIQVTSLNL